MNYLFDIGDEEPTERRRAKEKSGRQKRIRQFQSAQKTAAKKKQKRQPTAKQSPSTPTATVRKDAAGSTSKTSHDTPLSVAELTLQIKSTLEQPFQRVWVAGELTDVSRPRSGHVYFTLKDEHAQLRGVMWRSVAQRCVFDLDDGQRVLCFGNVEVYPPRGTYQLIVRKCQPEGMGALQLAFLQLQTRLAEEGLFDPERKRPLPRLPRRVAIVTSPSGAAVRDFLQAAAMRHAGVEIVIVPATVQGVGGAESVVQGIAAAHRLRPLPDVLIVSRGGGSLEDLWSFNEEIVVRALAASRIPTVSAVGHEVDVTLSDMAADVRALTPTDAASRVLPDRLTFLTHLDSLGTRLRRHLWDRAARYRHQLDSLSSRPVLARPHEVVRHHSRRVDELDAQGRRAMWQRWRRAESRLQAVAAAQTALSPLAVLARGYSVTQTDDGRVIRSVDQVAPGDLIRTRVDDGEILSTAEKVTQTERPD